MISDIWSAQLLASSRRRYRAGYLMYNYKVNVASPKGQI
jgi:hypothetical protein